ncbi:MAG: Uncharacterised protein [Prochlorococcus marinus str. MIT 9215]|nr:MAG: Uncharacterised protein [Prochlorococcus marinus str. MIT 9215]
MAKAVDVHALDHATGPCRNLLLIAFVAMLTGCLRSGSSRSWAVYPLQRQVPHDGLAVVSQPDGYGVHIFLETDTSSPGICTPLWLPDPARLFNGNGTKPFSSGLASREEFFAVLASNKVRTALKQELEALCRYRAPTSRWHWQEPPRVAAEVKPVQLPALEEDDMLTDPMEEMERQEALLNGHSF